MDKRAGLYTFCCIFFLYFVLLDYDNSDLLFDQEEFESEVYQRPFQYLSRQEKKAHLTNIDPATAQGDPALCLQTLLRFVITYLPHCYHLLTTLLSPTYHIVITYLPLLSPTYHIVITYLPHCYHLLTTLLSPTYHIVIPTYHIISYLPHCYHLLTTLLSPTYHIVITYLPHYYLLLTTLLSPTYHIVITYLPHCYHLLTTLLSPTYHIVIMGITYKSGSAMSNKILQKSLKIC